MKKAIASILTAATVTATAVPVLSDENKPTLFIAGDSTAQTYDYAKVYPQTGWGQVFADFFTDEIIIDNRSMGGRSSKRFDDEGRLDKILEAIKPGDYLFIQFGINDGAKDKPERYISVEDYKKLIKERYIGEAEKRGAIPVLMTPSAAAWWDNENNCFMESRADYADSTRELAKQLGCRFIDANRITTDMYNSMDKDEVLSGYFICEPLESAAYPEGTDDHTHLKAKGARLMAKLITEAIPECVPELTKYLKGEEVFTDIADHWAEDAIKAAQYSGIVSGIGGGIFAPDANVTRAEFLKMAMEAAGIPGHAYREGECFKDVKAEDWFCFYVQSALDKELIFPYMIGEEQFIYLTDNEAFNGDSCITREEMAAITVICLYYPFNMTGVDPPVIREIQIGEMQVSNEETDEHYTPFVNIAYSLGLFDGMEDGSFHPKDNLTRAQAVMIINRMTELLKQLNRKE